MGEAKAGFAARAAAIAILGDVLRRRRPLDAALIATTGLEPRDAGFARAIASETLRRLGQLDALIRHFVPKQPPPHKAGPTLEILLAGACEILFLDVAAHAAVDGANRLAAADGKAVHFKPLINAVLRRVSREGASVLATQDAAALNTPDWLFTRWRHAYGEELLRAIVQAHARAAPLDLVAKPGFTPEGAHLFGQVWRMPEGARVEALPGFAEGRFWVQDAAASLPAHLLGDVAGARVIDLCAAPGGKTMQLAAAGAEVTAVEREPERLARLRENLARTQFQAGLVQADARDLAIAPAPFVLLDAPCSATGTIRRHPDLPWIKGASDVNLCAGAAGELLDAAARLTAPGGTLVFAVCSLEPEEGPEQVAHFLSAQQAFSRAPLSPDDVFGHAEWITPEGDLRTLPCHLADKGGMDGFFAARLKRRQEDSSR